MGATRKQTNAILREIVWHQRQIGKLLSYVATDMSDKGEEHMTKRGTQIIMAIVLTVVIVWDVIVAVNSVPGDTVSEITLSMAYRHPIVPFAIGLVCGHLFWPQQRKRGGL